MAQEESLDADEMEELMRQAQSEGKSRVKKAASDRADKKGSAKAAREAEARGDDFAPWSKTSPTKAEKQVDPAAAAAAREEAKLVGLAKALLAKGEMWSRREAEGAVEGWGYMILS